MKLFHYKAYDKAGAKVEGILDAPDKASLLKTLKSQGLLVSQVVEKKVRHRLVFHCRTK